MKKTTQSVESKLIKYLNCVESNSDFILVTDSELRQIIEEFKDASIEEILKVFKNLEKLDYIKIKYFSTDNYLIKITEKGKTYIDNLKLKNSYIFRLNLSLCTFLLTVLGSVIGAFLGTLIFAILHKLC